MAQVCKYHCTLAKGQTMKQHWLENHASEYRKIRRWLGETEAKIASHELLAREGMSGRGRNEIPGPHGEEDTGQWD